MVGSGMMTGEITKELIRPGSLLEKWSGMWAAFAR